MSNFAELVASRICHDLISPVGAISNGVELLAMTGAQSEELQLVNDSAQNASGRVRFFRVAFGAANPEQVISSAEIKGILADLAGDRLQYDWQAKGTFPRPALRACFLSILCIERALPRGGYLFIEEKEDTWHIQANGPILKIDESLWHPMSQGRPADEITPATVSFGLLPMAISDLQRTLDIQLSESQISISF
ncbi:MAG: histidine phosphotransferase family protein [Cognatishimia sp.]